MNTSHIFKRRTALLAAALAVGTLGSIYSAHAAAIISNGTVKLGVDSLGQLNVPGGVLSAQGSTYTTGVRYLGAGGEYEFTADGCVCEGWGVADSLSGARGYADNATGISGLTPVSFTSTGTTATSVVDVGSVMRVTHDFHPSVSAFLYQVDVTVENTSGVSQNILYRRLMDWDIEPTAFSEYVTIGGLPAGGATVAGDYIIGTTDDGFQSGNPLSTRRSTVFTAGTTDVNFIDNGPTDHGALFDFDFGSLGRGETRSFTIFYGGAPTETAAYGALAAVSAELYSLGQSNTGGGPTLGTPATGIFGFQGIGLPPADLPVPEPTTVIGGIALAGLAASKMLRRKKA